jgi:hypothetical protein
MNLGNIVVHQHYWFTSCFLLVGSLVRWMLLIVVFFNFEKLRSYSYSWTCLAPAIRLVLAFCRVEIPHPCLLQLCKVDVLNPQLDLLLQFAGLRFCTWNWSWDSVIPHSRVIFSTIFSFPFIIFCLLFIVSR